MGADEFNRDRFQDDRWFGILHSNNAVTPSGYP
jgi:hypothetical protein